MDAWMRRVEDGEETNPQSAWYWRGNGCEFGSNVIGGGG